jgi:hypothetical protein
MRFEDHGRMPDFQDMRVQTVDYIGSRRYILVTACQSSSDRPSRFLESDTVKWQKQVDDRVVASNRCGVISVQVRCSFELCPSSPSFLCHIEDTRNLQPNFITSSKALAIIIISQTTALIRGFLPAYR